MSNIALQVLAWGVFGAHLTVGTLARRRGAAVPLVPLLNFLVSLAVVLYWAQRWIGYATKGIIWYWSDQLMPLYALMVCVVSALGLAGRMSAVWPHWAVFGAHTLALLAFALFASLVRFGSGI